MMEEHISMVLIGGIAAWTALFLAVRKILEKRSFDFCNRVVSLVHVAVAVWLSSVSIQDWRHPLHPPASPPSPAQCGSELTGCLWLMEISNPFMHTRQLLRELGRRDSAFTIINDVCFAIVFAFGRLICGPYLVYVTLTHENPFIIKAAASGLQGVSLFWFWKILTMVRKEMVKTKKKLMLCGSTGGSRSADFHWYRKEHASILCFLFDISEMFFAKMFYWSDLTAICDKALD